MNGYGVQGIETAQAIRPSRNVTIDAAIPMRQSQMNHELVQQRVLLDELNAAISTLHNKLMPVIRPQPGENGHISEKATEALAPMAETMREHNVRLNGAVSFLRELAETVEV